MKVRDSGMPDEEMWSGFFDPPSVLGIFGLNQGIQDVVEFGCGYGTFTLAAAGIVAGTVYSLDIEPEMVAVVRQKCSGAGFANVQAMVRDFVAEGTGLASNSMDAALLFKILHHEEPVALMKEALRVLKPNACLPLFTGTTTPRHHAVRPWRFAPVQNNASQGVGRPGSVFNERNRYDLPPYHYGLLLRKPGGAN
jgi:SAM-dependent methyltransferase